jgi:multidrug efflux pump subunit AcrA (membrane-fusion protein)
MLNTPKEDFLFLGEEKELLPSLSRWMNWGGLLIVGTFGLTITLASVFKYNVIIQAPARSEEHTSELQSPLNVL